MNSLTRLASVAGIAVLVAAACAATADTVVVRPGETNDWVTATHQGTATTAPLAEFIAGAEAPVGDGFLHMQTHYSDSDVLSKVYFGTNILSGIELSRITSLKYATFVRYRGYDNVEGSPDGQPPMVEITTDSGTTAPQGRMFVYKTWGPWGESLSRVAMNTWQEWDLMATDGRWELLQTGSSNYYGNWDWVKTRYTTAGPMSFRTPEVGHYYDGTAIHWANETGTSLSVKIGSGKASDSRYGPWWRESASIDAFVDKITIGIDGVETTYDLEPPVIRTVVIRGANTQQAIINDAKQNFKFTVFGEVIDTDYYSYVTLDDGSNRTVKVLAANLVVAPGTYVRATGVLDNQADPPSLTSSVEQIEILADPVL